MGFLGSIGHALGGAVKGIGKAVGAPLQAVGHAAATSGIPILNTLGSVTEHQGNALGGKGSFFGQLGQGLKEAAPLAAMAVPGMGALGMGPMAGMMGKLGGVLKSPSLLGNASGGFDLGKVLGTIGSVTGQIGQERQRKSAQDYNNAQIDMRNKLMSSILSGQNYGIPAPNLNQQSSATSGGY